MTPRYDDRGPWRGDHEPLSPLSDERLSRYLPVDTVTFRGFVEVWPFEFTSTPTYWYTPLRRPEMSTDAACGFGLDGVSHFVATSTPFSYSLNNDAFSPFSRFMVIVKLPSLGPLLADSSAFAGTVTAPSSSGTSGRVTTAEALERGPSPTALTAATWYAWLLES